MSILASNRNCTISHNPELSPPFVHRLDVERIVLLQKILRFLDYIIKGSYKAGGNKHIFTDQELYEEYNLTDEEINIIESVIKERK